MTSDAASGRAGLWTTPRYPGDAVRILMLKRGDELGDIRIQFIHDNSVKVCAFLPGEAECSPGDTPKVWPEKFKFARFVPEADALFDEYVQEAFAAGWQRTYSEDRNNG